MKMLGKIIKWLGIISKIKEFGLSAGNEAPVWGFKQGKSWSYLCFRDLVALLAMELLSARNSVVLEVPD